MRIGVVSDTHLNGYDQGLAKELEQAFGQVDMVLHAGDITNLRVLDALPSLEVYAVCGNMDGHLVAQHLPVKKTISAGGFKIGLIHGWGAKHDLMEKVSGEFAGVDCIVFGHSHQPTNLVKDGVLFFNPGSAAYHGGRRTAGILHLDETIRGEIINL